jgi:hypothetical protein
MADVYHSTLTGSDLHEPKGADAAAANRAYIADGAGSGSWSQVGPLAITGVNNLNKMVVTFSGGKELVQPASLEKYDQIFRFIAPVAGTLTQMYAFSDEQCTVSTKIYSSTNTSGLAITGGITNISNGSTYSDIASATPTANNTFSVGDMIECTMASTTTTTPATSYSVTLLLDVS